MIEHSGAMMPLSISDHELLLECVRQLHSFSDLASLRAWLLGQALPQLVPSDWVSYNEVDLRHPENTLAILKPEANAVFERLFPRFQEVVGQNPLIVRQMQSDEFTVHKISDFLSQDAFHRLELYQDVYRHLGVEYQIAATIKLEPDHVTAFALSRQSRDYTERDRSILNLLRPHLVVAFNNLALSGHFQTALKDHSLALSRLSSATLIVNPHGRILYHAGPGLSWIGATSPGILPDGIGAWLKKCALDSSDPTLRLVTHAGEIEIQAMQTTSAHRILLVLTLRSDAAPKRTAKTFGLTSRENEVSHWICEGKTNAEIAAILGVSPRTVHKHVEHIFDKTSAGSRLALTALLNEKSAAMLRW
jgi:DNA-binding CsgD family transcriptional regulator